LFDLFFVSCNLWCNLIGRCNPQILNKKPLSSYSEEVHISTGNLSKSRMIHNLRLIADIESR
jgi:hypothetical protein